MYEIHHYTEKKLLELLLSKPITKNSSVGSKQQLDYLKVYLGSPGIKAETIVLEEEYIDHDYLEDYAGYYARCFTPYGKLCSRLHFFSKSFSLENVDGLLNGTDSSITAESLNDSYLGFVVIKPLPFTFIGRTCLVPYESNHSGRNFPTTHDFLVHLFGIELTVSSLPFQEQDKAAAACATSALWSAFHGTGNLFHHSILSPVEITKSALKNMPANTRTLPNAGLTMLHMAQAVREVGLEPLVINASDPFIFKSEVYAYLRGRIPILLGMRFLDNDIQAGENPFFWDESHAITICGYKLADKKNNFPNRLNLVASRLEKIYCHDDQIGPFARMAMGTVQDENGHDICTLTTSWLSNNNLLPDKVLGIPTQILVPLYHKIRIPYPVIQSIVMKLDSLLRILQQQGYLPSNSPIEWDIHLTTANEYKKELLALDRPPLTNRKNILMKNLPRFLWRAKLLVDDEPYSDYLFDATDIEQGALIVSIIEYQQDYAELMRAIFLNNGEESPIPEIASWYSANPL